MRVRITFPNDEARARRVVSRSNHRVTGKHPGFKSRVMHHYESLLERDAFLRLDAEPAVISFREQPALIEYEQDGQWRRHYPDILVRWGHGSEFIEVKTEEDAQSEEVHARTALLTPALAREGYGYRVWTESEIRLHPRLDNARFLLRHGRNPVPLTRYERLRQLFETRPDLPWGVLISQLLGPGAVGDVCRLVLEGRLLVDLDELLLPLTKVVFGSGVQS